MTVTPALAAMAADISALARPDRPAADVARATAAAVGRRLGAAGLLTAEQQRASPDSYAQHLLHVDPDGRFSIVSLVWLPGQETVIHDHVSWCVVGVHQGDEEETLYRHVDDGAEPPYLVRRAHSVNHEGATAFFVPPGDIHKVRNSSDRKVISIHVYGADISVLGSSVRRRYDLPVRG